MFWRKRDISVSLELTSTSSIAMFPSMKFKAQNKPSIALLPKHTFFFKNEKVPLSREQYRLLENRYFLGMIPKKEKWEDTYMNFFASRNSFGSFSNCLRSCSVTHISRPEVGTADPLMAVIETLWPSLLALDFVMAVEEFVSFSGTRGRY